MTGNAGPDTENTVPLVVAEVIVTGAVPLETSVTGCADVVFTVTSPNVRLAELTVNWGLGTAVPTPFRLTTAVPFVDELLWIVNWPDEDPAALGAN